MPAARASGSSGGTSKAGLAVGRPPPRAARRRWWPRAGTPHAMASMAGSEKPSYSDGTTATWASAYMPASSSSEIPLTQCTARDEPEPVDGARHPPALGGPADHDQLDLALGAQLGQRLEQRDEALHGDVARGRHHDPPRDPGPVGPGPEDGVVDAHGHDGHAGQVDPHLGGDVALGRLRHRHDARQLLGHPHLHAQEPEPASLGEAAVGVLGVGERQHPVDGDGVVQGGEQRPAVLDHPEQARSQALVVVDDVEVAAPCRQQPPGPQREGPGLGEPGRAHDGELEQVDRRVELAGVRDPEGVGVPVQVEARDGGEAHPVVEHGPRLAGEDLDRVAQPDQLPRQVAGVDALATAAGVAPVDEVGDPQAPGLGRGRGRGRRGLRCGCCAPTRRGSPPSAARGF